MQIVIQRVLEVSVTVSGEQVARIGRGLAVFVGFSAGEDAVSFPSIAEELLHLRVCDDERGRLNRSVVEAGGDVLVVPEVTLVATFTKGSRPSFDPAAPPAQAKTLFEAFVASMRAVYPKVSTGVFQAHMVVRLANDGPATFVLARPH